MTDATPREMRFCRNWAGSPGACEHEVFTSADGSIRCRGCHLHPDACTCGQATRRLFHTLGYDLIP